MSTQKISSWKYQVKGEETRKNATKGFQRFVNCNMTVHSDSNLNMRKEEYEHAIWGN